MPGAEGTVLTEEPFVVDASNKWEDLQKYASSGTEFTPQSSVEVASSVGKKLSSEGVKYEDVVELAQDMSKAYVGKHANLAGKMRTLHRARTLLELMWVFLAFGALVAAIVFLVTTDSDTKTVRIFAPTSNAVGVYLIAAFVALSFFIYEVFTTSKQQCIFKRCNSHDDHGNGLTGSTREQWYEELTKWAKDDPTKYKKACPPGLQPVHRHLNGMNEDESKKYGINKSTAAEIEFRDVKDIFSNPFQLYEHGDLAVSLAVFTYALLRLGATMGYACPVADNSTAGSGFGDADAAAAAANDGGGGGGNLLDAVLNIFSPLDVGEAGGELLGEDLADATFCSDGVLVSTPYFIYIEVQYAIDLMLVVLCLGVAFTRAGYKEYMERGKKGAKDQVGDEADNEEGTCSGDHFQSVTWWLYNTFKSQNFRECIETCFGAALNIIDLQGIEPETKEIHDWILIVIFVQLIFVLAGENLLLTIEYGWKRGKAMRVKKASGENLVHMEEDEDFADTKIGKAVEMIFVHLSTLLLRLNLPFNEDSVNAVFVLYSAINVIPLFVMAGVETQRFLYKLKKKVCCCGVESKEEEAATPDEDQHREKLAPLNETMNDTFSCNYLTPEFHFEREFSTADVDDSGGLNKAEFINFVKDVIFPPRRRKEYRGRQAELDDKLVEVETRAHIMFDTIAQSVQERVANQGDLSAIHDRYLPELHNADIEQHLPQMNRGKKKNDHLIKRQESVKLDEMHMGLEVALQCAPIVTRQDILTGCVIHFDESSRDWLFLNQARSLLQFLKRGIVHINDHEDVNKLTDDEKTFRVMAALDLCNEVLKKHDIRIQKGQFLGNADSEPFDSMENLRKEWANGRDRPDDAEMFAYRTEAVAIMKANLYKVAALYSDYITPDGIKSIYKAHSLGNSEETVEGPWTWNLARAMDAMERLEHNKFVVPDAESVNKDIRAWFNKELKTYTTKTLAKDVTHITSDQVRDRAQSAIANNPHYSGRPASVVSTGDHDFHQAIRDVEDAVVAKNTQKDATLRRHKANVQKKEAEERAAAERAAADVRAAEETQRKAAEARAAQEATRKAAQHAEQARVAEWQAKATMVAIWTQPAADGAGLAVAKGQRYQKVGGDASTGWIQVADQTGATGNVHINFLADCTQSAAMNCLGELGACRSKHSFPPPGTPLAAGMRAFEPGEYFKVLSDADVHNYNVKDHGGNNCKVQKNYVEMLPTTATVGNDSSA